MPKRFPPVNPRFPHLLHGGDYNPEQWIDTPNIWDEDIRLLKLAHCNVVSIGIFSWAMLEPTEGNFNFDWLDRIIDKLSKANIGFVLATPSGAKPNWMALKYPEIRRCTPDGHRELQGFRHNHCYTSPVYREKTTIINTKLAERYGKHPSLVLWHVSNEYGGECHCPLCKAAFRQWLREKYRSIDALNHAYWAHFWSHTFSDFEQIDSIDTSVHCLALDWKRFVTDQTVDFMLNEMKPLRRLTPDTPVTVNMMGFYPGLNYWKFAPHVDVISWDSYPRWHGEDPEWKSAVGTAFSHDLNRSLKQKPFLLIESTPSQANWMSISPLKRPGMHRLTSLQAVAHGSDSVMYFQWRKSRGSFEKFHGAVVDHVGHENTRVFKDVAELGMEMEQMDDIVGSATPVEVAIIQDWENRWMIEMESGPRNEGKNYVDTCVAHYEPLWKRGIAADVIDMDQDFSKYKLLIAPMLYMIRPGVAERIARFVEAGGAFVATYFTGYVNENDLCFLTGFPGPLRKLLGIWSEELDAIPDSLTQKVIASPDNALNLSGVYTARQFCELIHAEGAQVLATYDSDFYAGRPAVTVNHVGKGSAYYIASRNDDRFCDEFIGNLAQKLNLRRAVDAKLPQGVSAATRTDGKTDSTFLMNFTNAKARVEGKSPVELSPYGMKVVRTKSSGT